MQANVDGISESLRPSTDSASAEKAEVESRGQLLADNLQNPLADAEVMLEQIMTDLHPFVDEVVARVALPESEVGVARKHRYVAMAWGGLLIALLVWCFVAASSDSGVLLPLLMCVWSAWALWWNLAKAKRIVLEARGRLAHQLRHAGAIAAGRRIDQRRAEIRAESPRGPRPAPQPFGVSHAGAEALAAQWMAYLGVVDAEVTRVSGDGGIDVVSAGYIAQVKNYTGSVGIAEVRELAGVAAVDGRKPLFFTSGAYPASAIEFADRSGMALFRYSAELGDLEGCSIDAMHMLSPGFRAYRS
jgi:hypothetical protein